MSEQQSHPQSPEPPATPADAGWLLAVQRGHDALTVHHVTTARPNAIADADQVRRLLASIIARRIVKENQNERP